MKVLNIKKFLNRWINMTLRGGMKVTAKIVEVILECGTTLVKYVVVGTREAKIINRSEIVDIYA